MEISLTNLMKSLLIHHNKSEALQCFEEKIKVLQICILIRLYSDHIRIQTVRTNSDRDAAKYQKQV